MSQKVWRIAGASVCGVSHEKTGQPCQDFQSSLVLADGTLIVAVADGAGSAAFAETGAAVSVRTAVEFLSRCLTSADFAVAFKKLNDDRCKSILVEAVNAAQTAVQSEAAARNASPRDLACTLIIVLACPGLVAVAHIGDGAVVASDADGKVFAVTIPKHGEYLNETTFLVSPNALEELQLAVWRGDLSHLAILSDGLQMLALRMPDGAPHQPFFNPLFKFLASQPGDAQEALVTFLHSPRLRDRADDDLTLVLAALVC